MLPIADRSAEPVSGTACVRCRFQDSRAHVGSVLSHEVDHGVAFVGADMTTGTARQAALSAFEAARRAGRTTVECYRAGVVAWRRAHPDHSAEYSAKQAVSAILARYAKIRVKE